MMSKTKIAFAGFVHETNTFSPIDTPYEAFFQESDAKQKLFEKSDLLELRGKGYNHVLSGFYGYADKENMEVEPLFFASATPSGLVSQDVFERIITKICEELQKKGPFDGVFLALHGAMVLEGYQDGETEILRRVRKLIGNIPLVASLDLHGNITLESFELSSAMVGYRTYPHIDQYETGYRCARIMHYLLNGNPIYKHYKQIPFIIPASSGTTNCEPAKSIYTRLNKLEKDKGIISVSFMQGFSHADIFHAGPSIFAYAENNNLAEKIVKLLYYDILAHEGEFVSNLLETEEAISKALSLAEKSNRPIILADIQDNAGSGSPSDTICILESLLRNNVKKTALGMIFDPESADKAFRAGEGSEVSLALGGKLTPGQKPLEAIFKVKKLAEGDFQLNGPMGKGKVVNLGKMAHLLLNDIHVVVSSKRMQVMDQAFFRQVGIEPSEMKILVLKSANHYRADFEPISSTIINVSAPAVSIDNPAETPYTRLRPGVRLGGMGPVNEG